MSGSSMGYYVHITRREPWFESEQSPITTKEWENVLAKDPSFERCEEEDFRVRRVDGRSVWLRAFRWTEHDVIFTLDEGRVDIKDPDEQTLNKMLALASELDAFVVGDDGELYGEKPKPAAVVVNPMLHPRPWYKRWFR